MSITIRLDGDRAKLGSASYSATEWPPITVNADRDSRDKGPIEFRDGIGFSDAANPSEIAALALKLGRTSDTAGLVGSIRRCSLPSATLHFRGAWTGGTLLRPPQKSFPLSVPCGFPQPHHFCLTRVVRLPPPDPLRLVASAPRAVRATSQTPTYRAPPAVCWSRVSIGVGGASMMV
jgi:hypothetical protein